MINITGGMGSDIWVSAIIKFSVVLVIGVVIMNGLVGAINMPQNTVTQTDFSGYSWIFYGLAVLLALALKGYLVYHYAISQRTGIIGWKIRKMLGLTRLGEELEDTGLLKTSSTPVIKSHEINYLVVFIMLAGIVMFYLIGHWIGSWEPVTIGHTVNSTLYDTLNNTVVDNTLRYTLESNLNSGYLLTGIMILSIGVGAILYYLGFV